MEDWFMDLEKLWAGYEQHAMPPTAPRIQRTEMRKAFITGYWSALSALRQMPDVDEDDAADALEVHWQEVNSKFNALDGTQ